MKGRIKRYINKKGYGFITGEDGEDYFFHISQFKGMIEPKNWMLVEFDITDGIQRKNAVNVRVPELDNTSRFITFGNSNIPLNDIKEYDLDIYLELYERYTPDGYRTKYRFLRELSREDYNRYKRYYDNTTGYKVKKYHCLRIKTSQKWYIFFEDEVDFDIFEKYDEINNSMKKFANFDIPDRNGKKYKISDRKESKSPDEKKDKVPVNIRASKRNNTSKSKFIRCGNTNIRLSNIKQYGITTVKERYNTGKEYVYNVKYLYITTLQNDNFMFREFDAGFNIFDKYNELNNAMKM